ncbi:hypothetical protein C1459_13710, partial [Klebsiella pneumoniae]
MPLRITPSVAEQEGQQTETEATGAPQKHHYTLNQQVGSITQLSNNADRPALAQAWLDNGDADATPDTITTPFIITPPISRVD